MKEINKAMMMMARKAHRAEIFVAVGVNPRSQSRPHHRHRVAVQLYVIAFLFSLPTFGQQKNATDKSDEQGMETGKLDLKQDSLALQDAFSGWWKKSTETLNDRMSWYNDAKFGCFVHWGVYADAGGEWKGKIVSGYSEHLMRKEQIPLKEYKEKLVAPFNPVDFDADEWMRHAKEAGMRYFIITAKHHDGFAMFHSDTYPYDLRLSKYKRDPMQALSVAAKKYGIKFGFYYSHAFDWEHPDAPGNDWMYQNPGGDKLLYGKNWWLLYPQFLANVEKYVNEKSIPQIKELITKYHPDILWFDTPGKLPLYENVRILKSIREIAPDIVINGRLARFAGGNLGDYKNTGDRAAYFFPVEGYWESIPTTNESYGYSKHDLSHKSVQHFVRLLASATSKGGNILMNVGPMGNGKWDEKDVAIFQGIGKWLSVNGEAIYGNTKTGLPLQSWGVTTQKDDILYLHVYHWTSDKKLIVGGLTSDIEKAWIVSDTARKPFKTKCLNDKDMMIEIPAIAPDTINTVIAVQLKNNRSPYNLRLLNTQSENTLYAFDATLEGGGFQFGDGKPNRNYVAGWKNAAQNLSWKFRLNDPAEFAVYIDYNTALPNESGEVSIEMNGKQFLVKYTPKLEREGYNSLYAGTIQLNKGEYSCVLKGVSYTGDEYMRPIAIRLKAQTDIVKTDFDFAEKQLTYALTEIDAAKAKNEKSNKAPLISPRSIGKDGSLTLVPSKDWTSGFFPGTLWYMYDYTQDAKWKTLARQFTAPVEREKTNGGTHDMGFKMYCSFGNGYRLTHDAQYKDILLESAYTLASRYKPKAKIIRSWDHSGDKWGCPVIIDNMMNLELLFWAFETGKDSLFYDIAVNHATTTMKNHFRPDYSSYHVVDYDTITGKVLHKHTHQGYAHESAWSRGQAWGLYGYTVCYRATGKPEFLEQAKQIAHYIFTHPNLPADLIPYWDYNAPEIPNEPRDVSAATVTASALYELSTFDTENADKYLNWANTIITNLSSDNYRAQWGKSRGFLLLHSVTSKPTNTEVDEPLSYADYYFLEALLRKQKLEQSQKK